MPKEVFKDGQIAPDSVTGPCHLSFREIKLCEIINIFYKTPSSTKLKVNPDRSNFQSNYWVSHNNCLLTWT